MVETNFKNFNHLKIHTQYSICEGAIKIDSLKDNAKEFKIKSLGLCDTSNLCGAIEFSEKVSKIGTQPIIGTQINFKFDDTLGLLPLFALNESGYKKIIELSSRSYLENDETSDPHLDINDLLDLSTDGIAIFSGTVFGLFGKLFDKGKLLEITNLYNSETNAQVPSYVPSNGLVGWWGFNGNPLDESGNGNNGNLNGAVLAQDRFSSPNSAFEFDGIDDYMEVLYTYDFEERTISLWFNADDISGTWNDANNALTIDSDALNYNADAGCPADCVYLTFDCSSIGNAAWQDLPMGVFPDWQESMIGIEWNGEWVFNIPEMVEEPQSGVDYGVHHVDWISFEGLPNWIEESDFVLGELSQSSQHCITATGIPTEPGVIEVIAIGEVFISLFGEEFSIGEHSFSAILEITDNPNLIPGCMYETALNYLSYAEIDDGSCLFAGCTDESAGNYSPLATIDDGSCGEPCSTGGDSSCATDVNYDGAVNVSDLLLLLSEFGANCD